MTNANDQRRDICDAGTIPGPRPCEMGILRRRGCLRFVQRGVVAKKPLPRHLRAWLKSVITCSRKRMEREAHGAGPRAGVRAER
jgi:hypothetical protein